MEQGTGGQRTSVEVEDSPSFADAVGDMFGDFLPLDEMVPDAGDGTTPDSEASSSHTTPEGSQASAEHADDTADAAPEVTSDPDQATPSPDAGDDALSGFTPFTYRSDNEERSVDGIRVHPEHGAIVDPEFVPQLAQRLSEADHYKAQSKAQHEQYSRLESATRWETTNAQGQKEVLTGLAGLEARNAYMARALALTQAVNGLINEQSDPAALSALLAFDQASGKIVWNSDALRDFLSRTKFSADQAEWGARRAFDPIRSVQSSAPTETPIDAIAPQTVASIAQGAGVTNLTPEDTQLLIAQLPQYVRATTADERKQDPTIGPRIVDASFVALVKHVGSMRQSTAKVAQTTAEATKANAARLAAAAKKPAAKPAVSTRQTPTQPSRAQSADDAWDLAERANAQAIRRRVG